jgi:hypothetical protein
MAGQPCIRPVSKHHSCRISASGGIGGRVTCQSLGAAVRCHGPCHVARRGGSVVQQASSTFRLKVHCRRSSREKRCDVRSSIRARVGCGGWSMLAAFRDGSGPIAAILSLFSHPKSKRKRCEQVASSCCFLPPDWHALWLKPAHFNSRISLFPPISSSCAEKGCGPVHPGG